MDQQGGSGVEKNYGRNLRFGITAFGIFLFFGATTAALAGATLIWPGTILDVAWKLNRTANGPLADFSGRVGPLFLLLSVAMTVAGIGWFRRRSWGWNMAVVIIATQLLGDLVNCFRGDFIRGGIGTLIASALLFYLFSGSVKKIFARNSMLDA